jgi:hypothetical protein
MAVSAQDTAYQLHVRLADIEPPIWRRILVPGQVTLAHLHLMLQVVMGWENYHLHQFIMDTTFYGEPDPEFADGMKDDRRTRLRTIARNVGESFLYEYDFGDSWQHVLTVEDIQSWTQKRLVPRCLDGARACPPEDCGGVSGYEHLLAALRDPRHLEHSEPRRWAGEHFDAELFSLQAANAALAVLR